MKWRALLKWVILMLAVACIVAIGVYGYRYFTKEEQTTALTQATTQVVKGELAVKVSGSGSIQPTEKETVQSSESGTVEHVYFHAGDKVKKGDILITLEGADVESQIRSKQLDIKSKQIDLEQMQENYKTATDEQARETLNINIQKKKLEIESAREDLASLQSEQQTSEIAAPIDGVLLSLDVAVGDNINPSTVIAEIANYKNLEIVVSVDELDIPKVKLGQSAQISVEAYSDESFTGKVTDIADEGVSSNGVATFDVTVAIDDPKSIKSGMSAEASILIEQKSDALMLPIDAVQSFRERYYVLVPGSGTTANAASAQRPSGSQESGGSNASQPGGRPLSDASGNTRTFVEVGIHNEDYIEIVSGLNEGDTVILPTAVSSGNSTFPGGGFGAFPGGEIPGGGFPSGADGGFRQRQNSGGGQSSSGGGSR